jgi:hypothetical protein
MVRRRHATENPKAGIEIGNLCCLLRLMAVSKVNSGTWGNASSKSKGLEASDRELDLTVGSLAPVLDYGSNSIA